MAQEVTLGGERLGSGNKVKQELHNYGMNSFNQGRNWWSTMAPGILYPCFKEIGTNFGTFDIDIDTFVRTLPTKGPLFGSFKMQIDLFNVPFRLYQGILHNNPTDIGLHMDEVYLPALMYRHLDGASAPRLVGATQDDEQVSTNSLIKYMGISGAGHHANYANTNTQIARKFQCVPELGYYDIFKNYYSNKQEENAYVITPGTITNDTPELTKYTEKDGTEVEAEDNAIEWNNGEKQIIAGILEGNNINNENIIIDIYDNSTTLSVIGPMSIKDISAIKPGLIASWLDRNDNQDLNTNLIIYVKEIYEAVGIQWGGQDGYNLTIYVNDQDPTVTSEIHLEPFALKNIDKMRAKLLGNCELGDQVIIDAAKDDDKDVWGHDSGEDQTGLPYIANVKTTEDGQSWSAFNQTGLVVKTYQSDMFNNWLDNSLVDIIAQRTKIDTTSGGFTPDTLILQEKIYKYLNRVLVSGGTYYDWQEATYGEGVARMCEIPMYIGGMSTEIMFEEVIANNESKLDGKYQALGTLAGKGTHTQKKGGNNIHVRMDEPGYIIGIVSLTPRISQFQGNDWDRTELMTMDDLHKPELDGIGFQDLMVENMCWWNTVLSPSGPTIIHRDAVGKQTAWLHYQTAIDKCYGDFAKADGYSFMVLSRQYEHSSSSVFAVKDLTTYIDPTKYNYAFAYNDLAAQNFWVEIAFKCVSRRKMGAQQLPTL